VKVHTDPVVARIRAIPDLASRTHLARAPKDVNGNLPATPLAIVYPADGTDTVERLAGPARHQHPRFTLHLVGSSYNNVAAITQAVKAQFIDADGWAIPLEAPGWMISNLTWSSPIPIQVDTDTTPPVFYQVIELGFDADPV
jgi:hypothetical protein